MALVQHENQVKILLANKFYQIPNIENMLHSFYYSSIMYYDGINIYLFNEFQHKILCCPESGIISLHAINYDEVMLVYLDKLVRRSENYKKVYNIQVSKYAHIRHFSPYVVVYDHGHSDFDQGKTTILNRSDVVMEFYDNIHITDIDCRHDTMTFNVLCEQHTYNIKTDTCTKTISNLPICKFGDYTLMQNLDNTISIYYYNYYLGWTSGKGKIMHIEHNNQSMIITYSDKVCVIPIKLGCFYETTEHIKLIKPKYNYGISNK